MLHFFFLGESVAWHLVADLFVRFCVPSSRVDIREHLLMHLMSSVVMAASVLVSVIMILCGNSKWYLLVCIRSTRSCIENKLQLKILLNPCSLFVVSDDVGLSLGERYSGGGW